MWCLFAVKVFKVVAFLALATSALVAPGYMLKVVQTPTGASLTVVICEGGLRGSPVRDAHHHAASDGPDQPNDHHDTGGKDGGQQQPACAFAMAQQSSPPLATEIVSYPAVFGTVFYAVRDLRPGRGIPAPPPPSTGPPSLI